MKEIIWSLKPRNDKSDYTDLVIKISKNQDINLSNYEVGQIDNIVHTFKDEIVDYLLEHGFSSLVTTELILEEIVPKGTSRNQIVPFVQKYLDKVDVDNELLIVDPYFFAKNRNPNYASFLASILDKYLPIINDLLVITNKHAIDQNVKSSVHNALKNLKPTLNIVHKISNNYHDRYWISNSREKGLVMGTSLNGLGNKVALVDRLNTSDVRAIVKELKNDGIL